VSRSKSIARESVDEYSNQPKKKHVSLLKKSGKQEKKSVDSRSSKLEPKLTRSLTRESVIKDSKPTSAIKKALISVNPVEK
jgi:hypothetical protein